MTQTSSLVVSDRYCYLYAEPTVRNLVSQNVGFSRQNEQKGYVQFALSRTNLHTIGQLFKNQLPEIKSGHHHVETLKLSYQQWLRQAETIRKILAKPGTLREGEEPLVVPHSYSFKVAPRDHQHKCFMILDLLPRLNVMLDCGTGKTFIMLTSTEYKIQKGVLPKGKTLVSCPLSIMETSWVEDAARFTNLKIGILWSNKSSRRNYGEPIVLKDNGAKPVYVIGGKKCKSVTFWNPATNQMQPKLGSFDKKEEWRKCEYFWYEGMNKVTGQLMRYGPEGVRPYETESRKVGYIQQMLSDPTYDVYLINHDGVRLHQKILAQHGFKQVILDESTKIKNATSQTFRAHVNVSDKAVFRYPMSGTPAPNGAIDLWGQFYFADRGMTLEPSFKDFRTLYFNKIVLGERGDAAGNLKEIAKYEVKGADALRSIANRLRFGSVRYRQDECLDLPERSNIPRAVQLTPELTKAYLEMEEALLSEFVDKEGRKMVVEASTALVKALRLRQINSGFASALEEDQHQELQEQFMSGDWMAMAQKSSLKTITEFEVNPKLETLQDIVEEIGENKIVVVTNYKHEIDMIVKRFANMSPLFIDGRVPGKLRGDYVKRFQTDPSCRMICLHPQAAGHGITLTSARYMVFFSMTNNYEHEYQVAKRIQRLGQKNAMIMYYLQGQLDPGSVKGYEKSKNKGMLETIDVALFNLIREKEAVQESLIDKHPRTDFNFEQRLFDDVLTQIMRRHSL